MVKLDVVALPDERPLDAAPFWAIDALEAINSGIASGRAPRRGPLGDATFARLHAQAAQLARTGGDPPMSMAEYVHAPKPLTAGAPDTYYVPANGPSQVLPTQDR